MTDPDTTASGDRHPIPRMAQVDHVRERIARGELGTDKQTIAALRNWLGRSTAQGDDEGGEE